MPEITEADVIEATGTAIAANATALQAIIDATFPAVTSAADSPATRYLRVTVNGVDYLLLAKLAP